MSSPPSGCSRSQPILDRGLAGERLSDDEVARFSVWMSSIQVRDEVWGQITAETADDMLRLLTLISRSVVPPFEPAVLSLTGVRRLADRRRRAGADRGRACSRGRRGVLDGPADAPDARRRGLAVSLARSPSRRGSVALGCVHGTGRRRTRVQPRGPHALPRQGAPMPRRVRPDAERVRPVVRAHPRRHRDRVQPRRRQGRSRAQERRGARGDRRRGLPDRARAVQHRDQRARRPGSRAWGSTSSRRRCATTSTSRRPRRPRSARTC